MSLQVLTMFWIISLLYWIYRLPLLPLLLLPLWLTVLETSCSSWCRASAHIFQGFAFAVHKLPLRPPCMIVPLPKCQLNVFLSLLQLKSHLSEAFQDSLIIHPSLIYSMPLLLIHVFFPLNLTMSAKIHLIYLLVYVQYMVHSSHSINAYYMNQCINKGT